LDEVNLLEELRTTSYVQRLFLDLSFIQDQALVKKESEPLYFRGASGGNPTRLYDFVMPVSNTGIVFVAALPGVMTAEGPKFNLNVRIPALRRAASTLAHWGMIRGGIITFMREALYMDEQALAAKLGSSEAQVILWETDQEAMPRTFFDILAALACQADERSYATNLQLQPPDLHNRTYRLHMETQRFHMP
jgi:hypothetical protein